MLLIDLLLTSASYPEFEAKVSLYSSYFETTQTHTHTHTYTHTVKMIMLYLIKKLWQQITSNIIN